MRAVGADRHGEHGVRVDEHRVHRHREAALGPVAPPLLRDGLQLGAQPLVGVARGEHAHLVAALLEPGDRLAHLADRAAFEREVGGPDDCFVAEIDRLETDAGVVGERVVRRARDRHAPALRMGDAAELRDQLVALVVGADRVAGDKRRPADDAIREERPAADGEEVALVATQREVRQAVVAVLLDERLRTVSVARPRAPPPGSASATARAPGTQGPPSPAAAPPRCARRRRRCRRRTPSGAAGTARRPRRPAPAGGSSPGRRARRTAGGRAGARPAGSGAPSTPRSRGPSQGARPRRPRPPRAPATRRGACAARGRVRARPCRARAPARACGLRWGRRAAGRR